MIVNARLIGCLLMAVSVLAGLLALSVLLVQTLGWWCLAPAVVVGAPLLWFASGMTEALMWPHETHKGRK